MSVLSKKSHTLDIKDKKLLYELDVNSRLPASELSKKVRLSKQVVAFRIDRLLRLGYIQSFYTVIDISKLGFTVHKSFLRLQNMTHETEQELIRYLKNHPHVVWVASCDGMFDLAFGTWAKDMNHLNATLTEINTKFAAYIAERQIATIIRGEYFVRDYLIQKKEPSSLRKSFFGAVPAATKIDIIDWKILTFLSTNARMTAVELASRVNISPDAVRDHIKRLEHSGVIIHYNIVPNESVYPFLHYKVLVSLRDFSLAKEQELVEYCRIHPNIVYIVKALGPWEFELDLEVESPEHFREILMGIKTKFSDLLKDYTVLQMYQVHKYNFCPSVQWNDGN